MKTITISDAEAVELRALLGLVQAGLRRESPRRQMADSIVAQLEAPSGPPALPSVEELLPYHRPDMPVLHAMVATGRWPNEWEALRELREARVFIHEGCEPNEVINNYLHIDADKYRGTVLRGIGGV